MNKSDKLLRDRMKAMPMAAGHWFYENVFVMFIVFNYQKPVCSIIRQYLSVNKSDKLLRDRMKAMPMTAGHWFYENVFVMFIVFNYQWPVGSRIPLVGPWENVIISINILITDPMGRFYHILYRPPQEVAK